MSDFYLIRKGEDTKGMYQVGGFSFLNHLKFVAYSYQVMTPSMLVADTIEGRIGEDMSNMVSIKHEFNDFLIRCKELVAMNLDRLPLLINDETVNDLVHDRLNDGY